MDIWISVNFCQLNCFRNNTMLHRWRHLATKTLRIFYLPVFPTSRFISISLNKNGEKWNFSCLSTFCLHAPRKVAGGGLHWTPEKIALIFFIEYLSFIKERSITAQTWWQTYNFCYYSILRFRFLFSHKNKTTLMSGLCTGVVYSVCRIK